MDDGGMDGQKDKNEAGLMKIGDLSRISGISVSTLYDYLRSGLLPMPGKESPTKAYFGEIHIERLREIKSLKEKGLTLSEIRDHLGSNRDMDQGGKGTSDDVRIAIVDKALELFSKFHYENTKISDITEALDMGNGTFYRYFKSKEELFLDCLERLPRVLVPRDAWSEVGKETDFILRLKKRGYAMLNAFPSYIGILNYAKLSLGKNDLTLSAKAAECIKSLVRPLEKDLKQAIEEGHVRPVDAELCAYLLLGINETFGYLLLMNPQYSVEKGFSIIQDFLEHAFARTDTAHGRAVMAEVTDTTGQTIDLSDLSFDGDDGVSGKYLEGRLRVSVQDIDTMTFRQDVEECKVDIAVRESGGVTLSIPRDTSVSGKTPFGLFTVPAGKLKQVRVFDLAKNRDLV
jgi:AcrR family transcriptional regulator/predicted DNA-binding transcriptional regulator AlpA